MTEEMKPGLKPRVPKPPTEKPNTDREPVTPHRNDVVMRNSGHCLYDLTEPFAITLVSVSNVNVEDFSLVTSSIAIMI